MLAPTKSKDARELFQRAQDAMRRKMVLSALRLAEEAVAIDERLPGLHMFRARCLAGIGRFKEAIEAAEEEIRHKVHADEASELRRNISISWSKERVKSKGERKWTSSLPDEVIGPIEAACHRYFYRGHAMIKNPFDMALYPLLLWNLKPRTVFEIGSYSGASALWMADMLSNFGVDAHIWSIDIVRVTAIEHPSITYLSGSGRQLGESFTKEMLASSPRPFLVIDDADHTRETSRSILDFFDPYLTTGEYVVVEDGLSAEGPREAIDEFLSEHADDYSIDAEYCDFYGYNATWCMNGFLRKKRA